MLSKLASLSVSSLRKLDDEANKFYDRKHDWYEAALLTRCYTQYGLRPYIDSEINHINTLIQELGSTKTYERISTDERSIVHTHSVDITSKFAVSIKEKQDRLLTLYWLPKLYKSTFHY